MRQARGAAHVFECLIDVIHKAQDEFFDVSHVGGGARAGIVRLEYWARNSPEVLRLREEVSILTGDIHRGIEVLQQAELTAHATHLFSLMASCTDPHSPEARRLFKEFEVHVLKRPSHIYAAGKEWHAVKDGDDLAVGAAQAEAALVKQYTALQSIDLDLFDRAAYEARMSGWKRFVRHEMARDVKESRAASRTLSEEEWQDWKAKGGVQAQASWHAYMARDFNVKEVETALRGTSTGTQPSPEDGITFEAIKKAGPAVWLLLSLAYTALLDGASVPPTWLVIHLRWIFKAGDPTVMANYRGVSLASVMLKIYERLLKNRSDEWCLVAHPASWLQDESNPGADCNIQLWLAREILAMRLFGMGLPTYVLQIDIRRAFPSAGREDVLESIRARGLGGAWLAAFWRLQEMAGVKLSTACGGYSGKVNFERGLLEGRVVSGDGFAFLLDGLRAVLEATGLGVKLAVRGG
ncbi:hypothetical protein M885DRAFT_625086 [Pelagophyceae sp. CCMP2097]|nr:hypothetical protein M885DRAFT_625086 [Pelagophyceae sp. CCMP2097]